MQAHAVLKILTSQNQLSNQYQSFQSPGLTCKDEHIQQDGVDDDGRVCHCYDDFCNQEVPTPEPNTTPGPGPSPDTSCDTTCTTTCSSMSEFQNLGTDATCSTSCTTTCMNNQGINGK